MKYYHTTKTYQPAGPFYLNVKESKQAQKAPKHLRPQSLYFQFTDTTHLRKNPWLENEIQTVSTCIYLPNNKNCCFKRVSTTHCNRPKQSTLTTSRECWGPHWLRFKRSPNHIQPRFSSHCDLVRSWFQAYRKHGTHFVAWIPYQEIRNNIHTIVWWALLRIWQTTK